VFLECKTSPQKIVWQDSFKKLWNIGTRTYFSTTTTNNNNKYII